MAHIKGENPNIVDAETARLLCVEEAIRTGMQPQKDWADWLTAAVKEVEDGGFITPEWLHNYDKQNSYP